MIPNSLRRTFSFVAASIAVLASLSPGLSARAQDVATPPAVGETAPDFELNDLKDVKVKLTELTAKGPVVLVMLRGYPGYQCPFCTAQVGKLLNKAEEFKKANARVLLVYPGPSQGLKDHASEFVRGKDVPENFYLALDPDYSFTNLYGLRWLGKGETSYPSTFVLDQNSKVLYAKISHEHGDRAPVEDVLAALPQE